MVFIFQFVNVVYHIDLQILKNPCIPGIKPTWSWCMIFLICCWILFARILLIFHPCSSVILAYRFLFFGHFCLVLNTCVFERSTIFGFCWVQSWLAEIKKTAPIFREITNEYGRQTDKIVTTTQGGKCSNKPRATIIES